METESITNTGLLDLIGNTPLLDVSFLTSNPGISLYAKAEWMNPEQAGKGQPTMWIRGETYPDKVHQVTTDVVPVEE